MEIHWLFFYRNKDTMFEIIFVFLSFTKKVVIENYIWILFFFKIAQPFYSTQLERMSLLSFA